MNNTLGGHADPLHESALPVLSNGKYGIIQNSLATIQSRKSQRNKFLNNTNEIQQQIQQNLTRWAVS